MKTKERTPRTDKETGKPNEKRVVVYASFSRKLEGELVSLQEKHERLVRVVQSIISKYEENKRMTIEDIDDLWNAI